MPALRVRGLRCSEVRLAGRGGLVCALPVSLFCSVLVSVYKQIANNPLWVVDTELSRWSRVRSQGGQQLQCSEIEGACLGWVFGITCVSFSTYIFRMYVS